MRNMVKYRPYAIFSGYENLFIKTYGTGEKKTEAGSETRVVHVEAGDSWVPASCEVDNRRSYVLLLKEGRRPGFANLLVTPEKKNNLALQAKKLGGTYKSNLTFKGNATLKKQGIMKTVSIKKILIPVDFSETGMLAMEHAVFMARLLKAELYLLHVVESFEYAQSIYEPEVVVQDTAGINAIVQERLEKLAKKISKENGINVIPLVESGKPSSEISGVVKDYNIDIVIMGTHGAHGFEEYFIGSNAHKVVNVSPCPVITVQQHAKKMGFTNIVMPIDNSLYSRQKVDYVIKLGKLYDSRIHILGLLNSTEEIDEKKFLIKIESVEKALEKTDLRYTLKIVKGKNVAEEAMKYSEQVNADLLVIMTDHESKYNGTLMGSLAKQIVNHSKIPVMSIRPLKEGHLDPVHLSAANPLF